MKAGIVGCGVASRYHIDVISKMKDVEIVGVCDTNVINAKATADRFKIKYFFTDLSKMIEQVKPDVVHILTPPKTHAILSLLAMNSGCHVLVEKPMAITTNEADEMIDAAEKNKVKLSVVHNHIVDSVMQRIKPVLQKNLLGNIFDAKVTYCYHSEKMIEEGHARQDHWVHSLPLNLFGEYAPHQIYILHFLLGSLKVISVSIRQMYTRSKTKIDALNALFDAENATVSLSIFTNTDYAYFAIDLYGVKANLHLDLLNQTMTLKKERNLPRIPARMLVIVEESFQNYYNILSNGFRILFGKLKTRQGHRILIKNFYESIRSDTPPLITGEEGRKTVEILELMEKQIRVEQNRPIGNGYISNAIHKKTYYR